MRPATPDDVDQIMEIEKLVHVCPWSKESFLREFSLTQSRFLVLTDDETDEKILGYVVYWSLEGEAQILNVAVPLEYRGLGFGFKLVGQVVRQAIQENFRRVFLEVRISNTAAMGLYQKLGFAITARRNGFYSDGEDAYVMDLLLNDAMRF